MSSHLTAPPLTIDNVMKVVEGVNWRTLCDGLFRGFTFKDGSVWRITPDDIQAEHQSDEARLKAVVEAFLDDQRCSWRMLIWALYKSRHVDHTEHIRSYAEPLKGGLSWKHKFSNHTMTLDTLQLNSSSRLVHCLVIIGLSS